MVWVGQWVALWFALWFALGVILLWCWGGGVAKLPLKWTKSVTVLEV